MSKKYLTDEEELGYFNSEKFKQDVKNIRNKKMDKYYTPELEDLFIGYELETLTKSCFKDEKSATGFICESRWVKNKVNNLPLNAVNFENKEIKTPYLTKEQIEAEGWLFNYLGKDDWFKGSVPLLPYNEIDYPFELWFKLDNYWLGFYKNIHKIVILEKGEDYPGGQIIRFNGKCPSINEFRKIIKLLEI